MIKFLRNIQGWGKWSKPTKQCNFYIAKHIIRKIKRHENLKGKLPIYVIEKGLAIQGHGPGRGSLQFSNFHRINSPTTVNCNPTSTPLVPHKLEQNSWRCKSSRVLRQARSNTLLLTSLDRAFRDQKKRECVCGKQARRQAIHSPKEEKEEKGGFRMSQRIG